MLFPGILKLRERWRAKDRESDFHPVASDSIQSREHAEPTIRCAEHEKYRPIQDIQCVINNLKIRECVLKRFILYNGHSCVLHRPSTCFPLSGPSYIPTSHVPCTQLNVQLPFPPTKPILSRFRLAAERLVPPCALLHQDLWVTMHRRHEAHSNRTANSLCNPSLVPAAQSRLI